MRFDVGKPIEQEKYSKEDHAFCCRLNWLQPPPPIIPS